MKRTGGDYENHQNDNIKHTFQPSGFLDFDWHHYYCIRDHWSIPDFLCEYEQLSKNLE